MRVLQVHTRYREPGGEDAAVAADRTLLREAGHEVHVFEAANPSGTAAATGALATSIWNGHAADRVREVAIRARAEVAHVHNTWFALSPSVLDVLSSLGIPVVMTLHNYRLRCAAGTFFRDGHDCELCLVGSVLPGLRHRCYRGSTAASAVAVAGIALHWRRGTHVAGVDRFLVPSDTARDRFLRAGIPSDQLVVRPNAVPDPGPRTQLPSASRTVMFVGRLAPEKGLATLLEAWRRASPRSLELLVVGDGPDRHLEAVAPPGVRFVGRLGREAVADEMRRARALVFPSTWAETFGLVPLEAMAAGLPVVVSDVGDAARFPAHDGGIVVPPGDVEALASGLTALETGFDVDGAGRRNRLRYEGAHSPAASLELLERSYRSAIAAHLP